LNIKSLLYIPVMLMMPLLSQAGTVTIVQGAAGDANFLPATPPSPAFSNVINFSTLTTNVNCSASNFVVADCPVFNSTTYASQGVTISSPDGLLIEPFSTQTAGGIYLADAGTGGDGDGTANITIGLANGVNALAVGISEFDAPIDLTIEAIGAGGTVLDSLDVSAAVEAAESAENTGNTYFVAEDTTPGIYGLVITQTVQTDESGLALAEVEATPEPSTFLLLIGGGMAMLGATRLRKRA
jgi:hypothetical protein